MDGRCDPREFSDATDRLYLDRRWVDEQVLFGRKDDGWFFFSLVSGGRGDGFGTRPDRPSGSCYNDRLTLST